MSNEDMEWQLLDKRLQATKEVIKAGRRVNQRSTLESNPTPSECTIEGCMDRMMEHLSEYYKNGGK